MISKFEKIINSDILLTKYSCKLEKVEFSEDEKCWRIFVKRPDGSISAYYTPGLSPDWFYPVQFLDEIVNLNDKVMFIPKNIVDLKAEGWTENDQEHLVKNAFWMGKKKKQLLGRYTEGSISLNKQCKISIYSNGYFFTPDQVKFISKPLFNKELSSHIKSLATNLNENTLPEFFKKISSWK